MREILFRGKVNEPCKYQGQWLEGFYGVDDGKPLIAIQQKTLRLKLEQHYQHKEIDELHILIRNRYSHILTEAEKEGCPICKKLVRVFDGRNMNG